MRVLKQLLAVVSCVGVFHMGAAFAAEAPKEGPKAVAVKEAAEEPKKDLILKGDAKCTGCHDEADDPVPSMLELRPSVLAIGKTKHGTKADGRTPTCTDCHGESQKHLDYKGKDKPPKPDRYFSKKSTTPIEAGNKACMTCHEGGKRIGWETSAHGMQAVSCTNCHSVHAQRDKVRDKVTQTQVCFTCHKEQRAEMNRPSHHPVPEGKMGCSDCHNAHGSGGPKLLIKDSVNETCYDCHMEKRGPFLHSHQPVTENCAICHNPHGTTSPTLLKQRQPLLCQNCHNVPDHRTQAVSQLAARSTDRNTLGMVTMARGCLNCHTNIHGSNSTTSSSSGGRFRQ